MSEHRDAAGRFASADGRKPDDDANVSTSDLVATLQRLLVQAEKADDFSGAATLARTILALEANAPPAPAEAAPGSREENAAIVAEMTFEERERWRRLLVEFRIIKAAVLTRLNRPTESAAKAALDRPTVMFQFCRKCNGFASFWGADDEETATFLIEHFGEDAMREAVLKFESQKARP